MFTIIAEITIEFGLNKNRSIANESNFHQLRFGR